MVTLHELDFPSLRVTDLQSADGGNTQKTYLGTPGSSTGRLRASLAAALPIKTSYAIGTVLRYLHHGTLVSF